MPGQHIDVINRENIAAADLLAIDRPGKIAVLFGNLQLNSVQRLKKGNVQRFRDGVDAVVVDVHLNIIMVDLKPFLGQNGNEKKTDQQQSAQQRQYFFLHDKPSSFRLKKNIASAIFRKKP